jgi:hypothetical protein
MSDIPVHLQRSFEQRWAAKLASSGASAAPKSIDLKGTVDSLPRVTTAKETNDTAVPRRTSSLMLCRQARATAVRLSFDTQPNCTKRPPIPRSACLGNSSPNANLPKWRRTSRSIFSRIGVGHEARDLANRHIATFASCIWPRRNGSRDGDRRLSKQVPPSRQRGSDAATSPHRR